jgi:hypothetical protein
MTKYITGAIDAKRLHQTLMSIELLRSVYCVVNQTHRDIGFVLADIHTHINFEPKPKAV